MRPKSLILLVLALGCGLIAAMGINQVLASRRAAAVSAAGETVRIFVAMQEIPARHIVDGQMIKIEEWPKEKVPEGAIGEIDKVEGRFARTTIFPGEPILEMKLVNSDMGFSPTSLIPKGLRVVSVRVDEVSSSSSLVLPGDRVDMVVYVTGTGANAASAKTVLQDVRVFAVNDVYKEELRSPDETNIKATTVSLLVTPEQAEAVTLASQMGQIRLTLRSRDDEDVATTAGIDAHQLLSGDPRKSDREDEDLMTEEPPAQGEPSTAPLLELLNQAATSEAQLPNETAAGTPVEAAPTHVVRVVEIIEGTEVRRLRFVDGKPEATDALEDPSAVSAPVVSPVEEPVGTDSETGAEGEEEPDSTEGTTPTARRNPRATATR